MAAGSTTITVVAANAVHRRDLVGLAHCTGFPAMVRPDRELTGRGILCGAGVRLEFECGLQKEAGSCRPASDTSRRSPGGEASRRKHMTCELRVIGTIRSPLIEPAGAPIQPVYAEGLVGTVEVFEPYAEGLADLAGFERIWVLYWCHLASAPSMRVIPYRDNLERGLFATRAPARPNPIGLSCVRLLAVEGRRLRVADLDILDHSPLLDIKPYVPEFDSFPESRAGWLSRPAVQRKRADDRFHDRPPPSGNCI